MAKTKKVTKSKLVSEGSWQDRELISEERLVQFKTVAEVALAVAVALGTVTVALIAPKALQAIGAFMKLKKQRGGPPRYTGKATKRTVTQAVYYLKSSGLIQITEDKKVAVTSKGQEKWQKIAIQTAYVTTPPEWEGTWWLVAADIPTEEHRSEADMFRRKIQSLQFYPLQRTLWLYPYNPCEPVQALAVFYGIEHYITVMEVRRLDAEDEKNIHAFFQEKGILLKS